MIENFESLSSVRSKINAAISNAQSALDAVANGSVSDWGDITNKPSTFPPSTHSHTTSDVTGLNTALAGKQDTLVSATNIKTVNGASLLGSGNLVVSGGSTVEEAELDFGASPVSSKTFVVSAAGVVPTNKILISASGNAATGRQADENEMDVIIYRASAGTGSITVYADCLTGTVSGLYKVNFTIGA